MNMYNNFHGEVINGVTVDEVLRQYFPNKNNGIFFDVGAFEPIKISNSYHFERNGWNCYCFEANTELIPLLKTHRNNVFNYAISNENKDLISFNVVLTNGWTAGFSAIEISDDYKKIFPYEFTEVKKISVPQRTLNTIIEKEIADIKEIDILSVDVEGGELNCLKGLNLIKYKPQVIVIENVTNSLTINDYLESYNYKLDKQIGYNQYFIHNEFIVQ
jgi:FkbM family methyltransferase